MKYNLPTDRRFRTLALAACATAALVLPADSEAQQPPAKSAVPPVQVEPSTKPDPVIEELVEAHNKERAKEKLPPLKLEAKLTQAAIEHAKDMADHAKMSHEGSDESTPEQRVVNAGYRYLRTGENVAMGYRDVAEVVQGWMDSPGHRHNIMGDFTEIGVARVAAKDGKPYWCANFGTPIPKLVAKDAAKELVTRLNDERTQAKLATLEFDEALAKAALDQATSLAKKKSAGGGTATFDGLDQKLYADLAVSTASGHPDAQAMVKLLLDRADLKAQVLGKYSRIGTGYATSEDGVPYWCLILANPAPSASRKSRR